MMLKIIIILGITNLITIAILINKLRYIEKSREKYNEDYDDGTNGALRW